jgi:hypothetical protein
MITKIKEGDLVRIVKYHSINGIDGVFESNHSEIGDIVKVTEINDTWQFPVYCSDGIRRLYEDVRLLYEDELEKLKVATNNYKLNSNNMSLQSTIKKAFRQEPEKTFVKVGFMDDNENITETGKEALLFLLWKEKKDDIKKLADTIQEQEK